MFSCILESFSTDGRLLKVQLAWKKVHMGWSGRRREVFSAVVAKNSSQAPQHKAQALSFRFTRLSVMAGNYMMSLTVTGVIGFSISPHSHLHMLTYASLWSKAVMSNTCLNHSLMWRIWVWLVAVGITAKKPKGQKQWVEIRKTQFDIYWNPHICFFHRENIGGIINYSHPGVVSDHVVQTISYMTVSMKNVTLV